MSQSSKEMDEPDFPDLDYKIRADCSFPLSLPSQPPDIRDWFSSYQYESPDPSHPSHDLDETQDPLGGFEIQQQEGPPKFNKDEPRVKDDRVLSEDGQDLVATTKRSDDEENGSAQEEILKVPVAGLKRKQAVRRVLGETCTNDDGLTANENSNKLKVGEGTLQREQSPKRCRSGELAASASKDGFISTKRRERSRPPTAVSVKNQENVEATSGVKRGGKCERLMREELKEKNGILADKTNVQVEVEQGNAGKWQCPRKRKPYDAPPLKQLRLEQWVRRVN
ncbi:uncharacterized protein A4U43_C10F6880 [Asparagus officinalis]|uniref:Uncharacterized protein n=1 Tax=Asparagus officinalis TaxID=4686 RepID=A0A5P1E1H3_ASPOF|nr:uncharacterized protein LOC109825340 [Asparagus officinalis]ONK56328.1 uncharacterized protein A4U43_C10F6880 [Asparagus officinalis]